MSQPREILRRDDLPVARRRHQPRDEVLLGRVVVPLRGVPAGEGDVVLDGGVERQLVQIQDAVAARVHLPGAPHAELPEERGERVENVGPRAGGWGVVVLEPA